MSQAKLAEAIDARCSQRQVSEWETDSVKPDEETVERIIEALEMSEEEFSAYLDPFAEVT
jgi:transcriptional regulator with XRE-family HTH domain